MRIARSLFVLCAAPLVACGDRAEVVRAPSVRDSAGVNILEIPASLASAVRVDTLSDPLWVLGAKDGALDGDMTGATSALVLPDAIVVADETSGTLRRYSLDGVQQSTGAGRGEGPGEMPMLGRLLPFVTGRGIAVLEFYRGMLHFYDDTLGFLRQQRLNLAGGVRYGVIGVESGGSLIVFGGAYSGPESHEDGVIVRSPEVVERIAPEGTGIDTLFTLPGAETYGIAGGIRGRRFAVRPMILVNDSGFVVSEGERWELRWLDRQGKVNRIVRLDRPRRLVTEAMRVAQLDADHARIDALPAGGFAGIRRMAALDFENPRFPDSLPPFDETLADGAGRIWMREGASPVDSVQHWLVFGSEGLERILAISTSLQLLAVGDQLVLVRREDDDGVGYLELRGAKR